MPIHALLLEKLGVRALLEHLALAEHVDDVGLLDRGEPVRYRDRGSALGDPFESGLHKFLALCRGVLIESRTAGGGGVVYLGEGITYQSRAN